VGVEHDILDAERGDRTMRNRGIREYWTGNSDIYGDTLCEHAHKSHAAALACVKSGVRAIRRGAPGYMDSVLRLYFDDPEALVIRRTFGA